MNMQELNEQKPKWITQDFDQPEDIQSIQHGGCASGAYVPAVVYHQALETMNEHGNDVLDFLSDHYGEVPELPEEHREHWGHIASFYLAAAVEAWAASIDWEELEEAPRCAGCGHPMPADDSPRRGEAPNKRPHPTYCPDCVHSMTHY